jgi:tetratricopeptide (TPR) repeat protein
MHRQSGFRVPVKLRDDVLQNRLQLNAGRFALRRQPIQQDLQILLQQTPSFISICPCPACPIHCAVPASTHISAPLSSPHCTVRGAILTILLKNENPREPWRVNRAASSPHKNNELEFPREAAKKKIMRRYATQTFQAFILVSLTSLAFLMTLSTAARAATKAPDYTVSDISVQDSPARHKKAPGLTLRAEAPSGHHFNLKAPMSAQGPDGERAAKPVKPSPRKIDFHFPKVSDGSYTVSIFVCDDALTFCERKIETLAIHGGVPAARSGSAASASTPSTAPGKIAIEKLFSHGFAVNRPDEVFKAARSQGKPIVIDFYGVWCPPCNLLDEKVFSSADFSQATLGFERLKLDVDTDVSWPYTSRYKVAGYPTVIFLTPEGDEISRIVGYRPAAEFVKAAQDAYAQRGQSLVALEAKAKDGDRGALDRLGILHLERAEYADAIHDLTDTKELRERLWDAKIGLAAAEAKGEAKNDNPASEQTLAQALQGALRGAIQEFPDTPDSVSRRLDLAEQLEKAKDTDGSKKLYREAITTAERIAIDKPELTARYDSSPGDLWVQSAEAHEALGEKDAATAAYRRASSEYRKHVSSPSDRGGNLELAYTLWKSGDVAGAEAIYGQLQQAYPDDFTFYMDQGSMNFKLGRYDKARPLAEKAVELSFGSNHLDSALLLAKIQLAQKHADLARRTIQSALSFEPPAHVPNDSSVRYYRSVQRIEAFRKQLS